MDKPGRRREDTLLLAANALLLVRANFILTLQSYPQEQRAYYSDRDQEDYASFQDLWDAIDYPGLIDDRITKPFTASISVGEKHAGYKKLIQSDAAVARMSFRDMIGSPDEKAVLTQANGGELTWQEWMQPICRWWPGSVVHTARYMVIALLKAGSDPAGEDAAITHRTQKGPRTVEDIRSEHGIAQILTAIHNSQDTIPIKKDVLALVRPHLTSKKAAKRVWERAAIPKWERKGRRAEASRMLPDELARLLAAQLAKRTPPHL